VANAEERGPVPLLPSNRSLRRGLWLAAAVSLVFLAISIFQAASTLFSRVAKTDVMEAAMEGALSGRVGFEVAWFVMSLILLHLAMGALAWVLACASAVNWARVREKFERYVIGWFALLAFAAVAYSALWHPRTLLGAYYHDTMAIPVGGVAVGRLFYLAAVLLSAAVLLLASWRVARTPRLSWSWRIAAVALPVLMAALGLSSTLTGRSAEATTAGSSQPNVIIIGIDSLRLQQVLRYGGSGLTPNLDAFIADADLFRDTTTPLARTFPSWIAILTGRSPTTTGTRFNLADRRRVQSYPTVGDVLRKSGYHTVFSMDEVRFANIDESYGFDQVISPRMGAPDFLLGSYNELPLSSVVINTAVGKWLFPYSYGNRGAATMYRPETYLGRLDREVSFERPTLFITHLTGAHWPYFTSKTPFGIPMKDDVGMSRPLYDDALRTVDAMFGDVITMLERKGALDHAIVVVLSDHGEALGLASDTFFADGAIIEGLRAPLKMLDIGHGQSVLSPSQYQVMLGFKSFGAGKSFASAGRDFEAPVSVEDISPTLLDLLGLDPASLSPSGQSLAQWLRTGVAPEPAAGDGARVRFTETDLRVLPAQNGFDEDATAQENSKYFTIDPSNGRMHIRENMAPLAIAFKERAAFTREKLLAAIPAGPDATQYLYFDRQSGLGRVLAERPGEDDPQASQLWNALAEHFGSEVKRPVVVTPQDWPAIDAAWSNFLRSIQTAGVDRDAAAAGGESAEQPAPAT
jgi:arylsulfatase A-like enzyme